jgi:uridine kinase
MLAKKKEPFLIGVAGGISSGKSSVCKKIIEELEQLNNQHKKHVLVISLDSFYKNLNNDELHKAERGDHNLDHPESFDEELVYKTLIDLIDGKTVQIPIYDKKSYRITGDLIKVTAETVPDVLIIEGILVFYYPKIRELCNMKLFVDCDADTRLSRRVLRDMNDYNRPLDHILNYYQKYVKPAFEEFCLPTKKYADVIIPRGAENSVAINLIVQHINDYLNSSQLSRFIKPVSPVTVSPKSSSILSVSRSPISISLGSPSSNNSLNGQLSPNNQGKRSDVSTRPH